MTPNNQVPNQDHAANENLNEVVPTESVSPTEQAQEGGETLTEKEQLKQFNNELFQARSAIGDSKRALDIAKQELSIAKKSRKAVSDNIIIAKKSRKAINDRVLFAEKEANKLEAEEALKAQENITELTKELTEANEYLTELTQKLIEAQELEADKAELLLKAQQDVKNAFDAVEIAKINRDSIKRMFSSETPDSDLIEYIHEQKLIQDIGRDTGGNLYTYNGKIWIPTDEIKYKAQFSRKILPMIIEDGFSNTKVNSVSNIALTYLEDMPDHQQGYIGFYNGVLRVDDMTLFAHDRKYGLQNINDYEYSSSDNHAPNFDKWLAHTIKCDDKKAQQEKQDTIMATLYLVMMNHYEWQYFIEVIGEGGTGKSIFMLLCKLLSAKVCSISMEKLESSKQFALESLLGCSLILIPDAKQYIGEMNRVKAITGNDPIEIEQKWKKPILLDMVRAVLVTVANQPMSITDKSTAVFRRRVSIFMDNVVQDKDAHLGKKLSNERGAIFNKIANYFNTPDKAREVLEKATTNADKIRATTESDHFYQWVADSLEPTHDPKTTLQIGGKQSWDKIRKELKGKDALRAKITEASNMLYSSYLNYCEYLGTDKPLSIVSFPKKLTNTLKSLGYNNVLNIKQYNKSMITGVKIKQSSPAIAALEDMLENFHTYRDEPQLPSPPIEAYY